MGKTLRFPRFKSFKEERDWRSALSITEFNELKAKVDQERDAKMDVERRTKRASIKRKREVAVIGMENAAKERGDGAGVKKPYGGPSTMLFEGFKFYIMTESLGPEKKSKAELEQLVKANGAKFFQTENADPDIKVIGDRSKSPSTVFPI